MSDQEYAWNALASYPIRRAMLGRARCDDIVATAVSVAPAGADVHLGRQAMRRRWESKVREAYAQRAGFAFMTMLIVWAIGAIVEALVRQWWENHK